MGQKSCHLPCCKLHINIYIIYIAAVLTLLNQIQKISNFKAILLTERGANGTLGVIAASRVVQERSFATTLVHSLLIAMENPVRAQYRMKVAVTCPAVSCEDITRLP